MVANSKSRLQDTASRHFPYYTAYNGRYLALGFEASPNAIIGVVSGQQPSLILNTASVSLIVGTIALQSKFVLTRIHE
jgi:hypothetical protein